MSFELFSWKYMIRNFLNVLQLWTSKVLHHTRPRASTEPSRSEIPFFFVVFSGKDKLWVGTSLRCTSHWLIWRRSVFAHLAYLMRCTFFIQQEACALRITLNYVHNGTVCRAFLPLITHMFCITCSACSLPSSANRTKVHTNERQKKKKR